MAQATANQQRIYEFGVYGDQPVAAGVIIYEGSAVGYTAGYARQLVAGDVFGGFAMAKADATGLAAGAINVNVHSGGYVILPMVACAITDVGSNVYASDGNTFTLTVGSNTLIGTVHKFISTNLAVVKFNVN